MRACVSVCINMRAYFFQSFAWEKMQGLKLSKKRFIFEYLNAEYSHRHVSPKYIPANLWIAPIKIINVFQDYRGLEPVPHFVIEERTRNISAAVGAHHEAGST